MNTEFVEGSLPVHYMTGVRFKKERDHNQLYKLAASGKSKDDIASELKMSKTTFYGWLSNDSKAARVWEAGARFAGTFTERQRPGRTCIETDEDGTILLQPIDDRVVAALRRRTLFGERLPEGKRVKHLRAITGLDTHIVIASLERLEIHGRVYQVEMFRGYLWTEYFAIDEQYWQEEHLEVIG